MFSGKDVYSDTHVHLRTRMYALHTCKETQATEDIGYYDYRPVTLLFACFISFQRYALS